MPANAEIFRFDTPAPLKLSMQRIGNVEPHAHELFEMDFILSGQCTLRFNDRNYTLHQEDIAAFNAREVHALRGTDCVLITLQFEQSRFEQSLTHPMHPQFFCMSAVQGDSAAFDQLRTLIARIVKNSVNQEQGYELRNYAFIYELMDLMYNNFRVEGSPALYEKNHRYAVRMREITEILEKHHAENITLSDVAKMVYLSPSYLSRFFSQQFGTNFVGVLTKIRLDHAMDLLMNTDMTIESISAESGFPNSHAFVQAFKKEYDLLPSVYRRRRRTEKAAGTAAAAVIEQTDYMAALKKYLIPVQSAALKPDCTSCSIRLDVSQRGVPLRHTWRTMTGVASASDLLLSDVQDMVRRIQREIGFQYIKFNGIFSDDLQVCSRDASGKIVYNFVYLDKVFDFLASVRLRPMIQLSFMPAALAKDPNKKLMRYLVSEPKDLREWSALVRAVVSHLIGRYGSEAVRAWKFTVWHQPNSTPGLYGFSNDQDFYAFYKCSWEAIKNCDPALSVGAPPSFYLLEENYQNWYIPFLDWCRQNECMPDFLSFNYYDTVLSRESLDDENIFGFAQPMTLRNAQDGVLEFVNRVLAEREALGLARLPVYLNEWNNTPSQEDLLNDTCFKSCYIVKNILENYDRLESFGYWSLTDLMGEAPAKKDTFYGGVGLFTVDGIPKASYNAMLLLRRLGGEMIGRGDGWFAARSADSYQLVIYNYRHFSALYARGERFDMTFTDRYTPFSPDKMMDVQIELRNPGAEDYVVTEMSVSRTSGSAFDQWLAMGAVEPDSPGERSALKSLSVPHIQKYRVHAGDQTLKLNAMVDMLEVRLLLVTPARAEE